MKTPSQRAGEAIYPLPITLNSEEAREAIAFIAFLFMRHSGLTREQLTDALTEAVLVYESSQNPEFNN